MGLTNDEKFEVLKIEMGLIQNTLDKYDDFIFRNRNWFITLWIATIGLSFSVKSSLIALLATGLCFIYWLIEGVMRSEYWYKYVLRYRAIRNSLNQDDFNINKFNIYDLTNKFGKTDHSEKPKIKETFFKFEPGVIYFFMAIAALVIFILMERGVL